jgi:hypothetical protein
MFLDGVPAKTSVFRNLLPTGLWRSEIPLFAVKLVVFKGEQREFGSLFIAIGRFFEDQHILGICRSRRTHDPFDLRLRHTVSHLVVIIPSKLRPGEWVSIAGRCQ